MIEGLEESAVEESDTMERLAEAMSMMMQQQGEQMTAIMEQQGRRMEQQERVQAEQAAQMKRLLDMVTNPRDGDRPPVKQEYKLKMPKYSDGEDIETYLKQFEGNMKFGKVDEAEWVKYLITVLAGKASEALRGVEFETISYADVKERLLRYFNISPSSQREKLRRYRWSEKESPGEYCQQKKVLIARWLRPDEGVPQMLEKVLIDSAIETMETTAQKWIRERDPQMEEELLKAMRLYLECGHRGPNRHYQERRSTSYQGQPRRHGNTARTTSSTQQTSTETTKKADKKTVTCYKCHKLGHFARECPEKAFLNEETISRGDRLRCKGTINQGREVEMWLDTGCSRTTVRSDLVPQQDLKKTRCRTRTASGELVDNPLADVELEVQGTKYRVEAAVSNNLPVSVLIGRDVPVDEMVAERMPLETLARCMQKIICREGETTEEETAFAVQTRNQRRQEMEAEEQRVAEEEAEQTKARPLSLTEDESDESEEEEEDPQDGEQENGVQGTTESEESLEGPAFNFDAELFGATRPNRSKLTRTQRKEQAEQRLNVQGSRSTTLREEQEKDAEIQNWRSAEAPDRLRTKNGLLYRVWTPRDGTRQTMEQLVLLKSYRGKVLEMAHNLPMSGHLGREKTTQRLLKRFYWPTLFADVRSYCRSCPECQMSSKRGRNRASLLPLPVIEEPFSRIAMDVVGPLPKTGQGHRYILVVCDYATRYPEAFLLRKFTATAVAEQLIEFFSRHGVPREVLTDQGTNFTASLLKELYERLGVKPIKTTPYHPQTDGLVERFNQTLKQMLKKFVEEEGKNWNKLLPYVLFAYREVPQATTGFSPFELVYGRDVRGPLDVLKDGLTQDSVEGDDIVSYVNRVYERLQAAKDIVQDNLRRTQAKQKAWYDQRAREVTFEKGDQVLVMLPTRTEKLLTKWRGPYTVVEKVGKVNYAVEMPDAPRKRKLFHVNMLKHWLPREDTLYHEESEDPEEDLDVEWRNGNSSATLVVGAKLSPRQRQQIRQLLKEHPELVKDKPGRTSILEHTIPLTSTKPIRQRPYRIPAAYRKEVEKEIEEMLEHGVIEPTTSPWASPMVVVHKKDGSAQICVDYRQLNSITDMDAYPLPRMEDILDAIGTSQYITTLDLAKGYWQVPVMEPDRDKTAFVSPLGLFRFTTMPFGLCGAPATFQRAMDSVLRGKGEFARAYLDDIAIFSNSWEEHLQHLETVFECLETAGFTVKLKKCQLGMSECLYLGHRIGGGVVKPEADKIEAVRNYPRPTTKKDVRAFLGLAGYYRRFIPNFAGRAKPLTDLTSKRCPDRVEWTAACQSTFEELKNALISTPVLHNPDFKRPFVLQTDASNIALGAVLAQIDDSGEEHPISYWSRKLLP